jgi:hypothetical protein
LYAGTYIVTVTNAKGCMQTMSIIITQPTQFSASITSSKNSTCYGNNNGFAQVNASGGVAPYNYSWNTIPVQTSNSISGLSAGTYTTTVSDQLGCSQIIYVSIYEPSQLLASVTSLKNVSCNSYNTGSATLNVSGGSLPYTYAWNSIPAQTYKKAINLTAGSYTATVTDASGCNNAVFVTITQPTALVANITNVKNVTRYGRKNGSATVSVSGGNPPYTYSWSTSPIQKSMTANNLAADNYVVTVIDKLGCSIIKSVVITQPLKLTATISMKKSLEDTASLVVNVNGGVPPYTYAWTTIPEAYSAMVTGLYPGTYRVSVHDFNLDEATDSITIEAKGSTLSPKDTTKIKDPSGLNVYPNPAVGGEFYINNDNVFKEESVLVVLFNSSGQEVYSKVIMKGETTAVDLEGRLAAGIYYVVASSNDNLYKKKLLITK